MFEMQLHESNVCGARGYMLNGVFFSAAPWPFYENFGPSGPNGAQTHTHAHTHTHAREREVAMPKLVKNQTGLDRTLQGLRCRYCCCCCRCCRFCCCHCFRCGCYGCRCAVLCRCDVLPVWIGSYRGPSALRGLLGFLGHVGIHGSNGPCWDSWGPKVLVVPVGSGAQWWFSKFLGFDFLMFGVCFPTVWAQIS